MSMCMELSLPVHGPAVPVAVASQPFSLRSVGGVSPDLLCVSLVLC